MKPPNRALQFVAIGSSLLLVGGLVSYRTGALGRLAATWGRPGGWWHSLLAPAASRDPDYLPGSKSKTYVVPPASPEAPASYEVNPAAAPPGTPPHPTFMAGSKSITFVVPPGGPTAQPPAPGAPAHPAFLPGSKSDPFIVPPVAPSAGPSTQPTAPPPPTAICP
ncbi:hypothetical protein [Fimbriiglobus ruber]|uniref:Uncharacterized protein n=1 Tax=Fimbriiglobus ruber TaxID=1908690 RepID=A0A225DSG3_9BACT|nr:hypothetical protein [Fimbriiglobus ruber]OWK39057.1 hypothetical protein FRUB_06139 [Fimbriiglobus ruber]